LNGYLLDTNIVGHYFCEHPNVIARVDSLPDDAVVVVSAITLGEIAFGHEVTVTTDQATRDECALWINSEFPVARVLPIRRTTRTHYGMMKSRLFRTFPPISVKQNHPECCIDRVTGIALGIDENDLWIAAQAVEHNLILVTNDEMGRIVEVSDELTLEDWTLPYPYRKV
jgi:tRNA(fMet)-specific endonuclease VapC